MSVLDALKSILPGVASAAAGPLGGVVVKAVADRLGVPDTIEAVAAHLTANPADVERLRDIEVELARLAVEDRASARDREVAVAATGGIAKHTTPLLALLVVGAAFLFCYALLFFQLPPQQESVVIFVLGFVTASATQVLSYYFGSSQGSKDKTDEIKRLVK